MTSRGILLALMLLAAPGLAGCIGNDLPVVDLDSLAARDFSGTYAWPAPPVHDVAGNALPTHPLLAEEHALPHVVGVGMSAQPTSLPSGVPRRRRGAPGARPRRAASPP